jgi:hypothetical protein
MRQRLGSHLSYANVMATIAVFMAIGGTTYAATGGNFILGNPNSATSTTALSAPIAGKALQVTNTSTGAGATGLGLNVASGHPPFTVNSGTKVANLNADKLDGTDSTGFIRGRRLEFTQNADPGSPVVTIATVGPYAIRAACYEWGLQVFAKGPAGKADTLYSKTRNDATDLGTSSAGSFILANTDLAFLSMVGPPDGSYDRAGGTAMLRSGSVTVQVDFNAVVDNSSEISPHTCSVYGTATMAT